MPTKFCSREQLVHANINKLQAKERERERQSIYIEIQNPFALQISHQQVDKPKQTATTMPFIESTLSLPLSVHVNFRLIRAKIQKELTHKWVGDDDKRQHRRKRHIFANTCFPHHFTHSPNIQCVRTH